MNPPLPLEFLRAGEWADVAEITGEPSWIGRMAELGLRAGCRVQVVQGGTPCLVQINGTRLCLRGTQAMHILVHPVALAPAALRMALERC
jgi:Fe2+ transport system protein FeoA